MTDSAVRFDQVDLMPALEACSEGHLDALGFGVIGFDASGEVRRYNAVESRATGLHPEHVIGRPLFTDIAQCMNNYLVAQRFDDAAAAGEPLDATIDYLLTWRMRPTPVRMRLLHQPGIATRYVLIHRLPA